MNTRIVERKELYQIIDELSDDRLPIALDFIRHLKTDRDVISDETVNAETLQACKELKDGHGKKYESAAEMYADLGI